MLGLAERCSRCTTSMRQTTWRQITRAIYCTFFGLIKGAIMLPLVVSWHVLGVLFTNLLMTFAFVDHGYAALRFTHYIGPNVKCVLALVLPVAIVLFHGITVVAALFFSIAFALGYPVFVTIDAQAQTGFRYTYLYSAWSETLGMTEQNAGAYWHFCTNYLIGLARHVRTARFPPEHEPWDLHPLNWLIALGLYIGGWAVTSLLLIGIIALKLLPMLLRAYSNHIYVFKMWAPLPWHKGFKWYMGIGYFLAFGFFPLAGALLFPAMVVYAAYLSAQASVDVLAYRGRIGPGLGRLSDGISLVQKETSRYIMRQDVPFLVLPSHNPISFPWLLAGLLPWVFALVVVPPLVTLAAVVALLPCMSAAAARVLEVLHSLSLKDANVSPWTRAYMVPVLLVLFLLTPAIVVVGLGLLLLRTILLSTAGAIAWTHKNKSVWAGLQFAPGLVYATEYSLNKFAYALSDKDQVHWASCCPPAWADLARPFMPPTEFEPPIPELPPTVVGKPARYLPRGTRKPRRDPVTGALVDVSGEGYIIPGVGFARMNPDGSIVPVLPKAASANSSSSSSGQLDGEGGSSSEGGDGSLDLEQGVHTGTPKAPERPANSRLPPALAHTVYRARGAASAVARRAQAIGDAVVSPTGEGVFCMCLCAGSAGEEVDAPSIKKTVLSSPTKRQLGATTAAASGGLPRDATAVHIAASASGSAESAAASSASSAAAVAGGFPAGAASAAAGGRPPLVASAATRASASAAAVPSSANSEVLPSEGASSDAGVGVGGRRPSTGGGSALSAGSNASSGGASSTLLAGYRNPTALAASAAGSKAQAALLKARAVMAISGAKGLSAASASASAAGTSSEGSGQGRAISVAVSAPPTNAAGEEGASPLMAPVAEPLMAAAGDALSQSASPTAAAGATGLVSQQPHVSHSGAPVIMEADNETDDGTSEAPPGSGRSRGLGLPTSISGTSLASLPETGRVKAGVASNVRAGGAPAPAATRASATASATASASAKDVVISLDDDSDDEEDAAGVTAAAGHNDGEEYDEEDDEEEEMFVLQPIVKPHLPDAWVITPVPGSVDGETYFVNYARQQSAWTLPSEIVPVAAPPSSGAGRR